ncbi:uncharacterized protein LOC128991211 isoform X2 [Macrosteles quadrilineatus]|uniref:uncharacterized protein LOC128991211 isoform X2 n=1 Tax=Macrosteles quadrilineatus TaxID=74068 RepID=UPI0023E2BCEE|nr:uncharacterized protein LOC128991211 isoform X2 [Macrosteles quadrilineatus]
MVDLLDGPKQKKYNNTKEPDNLWMMSNQDFNEMSNQDLNEMSNQDLNELAFRMFVTSESARQKGKAAGRVSASVPWANIQLIVGMLEQFQYNDRVVINILRCWRRYYILRCWRRYYRERGRGGTGRGRRGVGQGRRGGGGARGGRRRVAEGRYNIERQEEEPDDEWYNETVGGDDWDHEDREEGGI